MYSFSQCISQTIIRLQVKLDHLEATKFLVTLQMGRKLNPPSGNESTTIGLELDNQVCDPDVTLLLKMSQHTLK